MNSDIYEKILSVKSILGEIKNLTVKEKVDIYNMLSDLAFSLVNMKHPILNVKLVPASSVKDNDYNPNKMASPEFRLLKNSIRKNGLTFPIVVSDDGDFYNSIVDGSHRTKIIKNNMDIKNSLNSYIPVVTLSGTVNEIISASVRHNTARGNHQVELTSKLVMMLKMSSWDNEKISHELGMEADEVLRMQQVTGLAEAFKDNEFSMSWE
ncbi:ParB N-terminal domain-containing protein [Vibrio mimicus]|uniref:ParB N-terminal domain-containing protein n=1 Tax=Vibrio mimicus TaxID=674 RepID=UPI000878ED0E|nr:ParB N-terminal domain-containing protein [Vibrio mimicus]AOW82307.1 chromosome partitioning protein ParB [Vibrio mimicus]